MPRLKIVVTSHLVLLLLLISMAGAASPPTQQTSPQKGTGRAGTITQIDVDEGDEGVTLLITGDGAFQYEVRRSDQDRLVIDLLGVKAPKNLRSRQVGHPLLKEIRIGRYPNKVRLALRLSEPSSHSVQAGKATLAIKLVSKKPPDAAGRSIVQRTEHTEESRTPMPPTAPTSSSSRPAEQIPQAQDERSSGTDRILHAQPTAAGPPAPRPAAEPYIAIYGGIPLHTSFEDVRGIESFSEFQLSDFDLARSGVAGLKLGVFQPSRIRWFGMETELFYTSPHVKQQDITFTRSGTPVATTNFAGARVRVATWALNWIVRYPGERVQPYIGAGLGIFWGRISGDLSTSFGTSSDTSPGLNALAGARLYLTKRIVAFGEYKYNRTTFDFGGDVSVRTLYQAHHLVGGLSLQF